MMSELSEYFMLRAPAGSLEKYKKYLKLFEKFYDNSYGFIQSVRQDKILMETILAISEELYLAVLRAKEDTSAKKLSAIADSLKKYCSRYTTRTSPLGLLSTISFEKWDIYHHNEHTENSYTKSVRIDAEWLMKLINKIETDSTLNANLKVEINPNLIVNAEKGEVINPYIGSQRTNTIIYSTKISYTSILESILSLASKGSNIQNIKKYLVDELNNEFNDSDIDNYISSLMSHGLLVSNIRTILDDEIDTLGDIIDSLEDIGTVEADVLVVQLKNIRSQKNIYEALPIGEGIECYLELTESMGKVIKANKYLRIDLGGNRHKFPSISYDHKVRLTKVTDALKLISMNIRREANLHEEYKTRFLEKYGTDVAIKLVDILDEYTGIGTPINYVNPIGLRQLSKRKRKIDFSGKITSLIREKLVYALKNNIRVVDLEDLKEACEVSYEAENGGEPFSEIAFLVYGGIGDEVAFEVSPVRGSHSLCCLMGRFKYLAPHDIEKLIEEHYEKEEEYFNEQQKIVVEIIEFPNNNKLANITSTIRTRKTHLVLGEESSKYLNQVDLNDIYIFIDSKSLKWNAYSRKNNKLLVFKSSNYLNPIYSSNHSRLLEEITSSVGGGLEIFEFLDGFDWGYMPAIYYGDVCIKPESWVISREDVLRGNKKKTHELVRLWVKNWKVSRYVYIGEYDQRILLDLKNDGCLSVLVNEISKNHQISLYSIPIENFGDLKSIHEVIFTVSSSDKEMVRTEPLDIGVIENGIMETKKAESTESNWVGIRVFSTKQNLEHLIAHEFPNFRGWVEAEEIKNYFFIKFYGEIPHIAIRVEFFNLNMVQAMIDWLHQMLSRKIINNYLWEPYLPEYVKFGGIEALELYNAYRTEESGHIAENYDVLSKDSIYYLSMSLIKMFSLMGNSLPDIENLLEKQIRIKGRPKLYNEMKEKLMAGVPNNYSFAIAGEKYFRLYAECILELENRKSLPSSLDKVIFHVFHQLCNRLGIDNDSEYEIKVITRLLLRDHRKRKELHDENHK